MRYNTDLYYSCLLANHMIIIIQPVATTIKLETMTLLNLGET